MVGLYYDNLALPANRWSDRSLLNNPLPGFPQHLLGLPRVRRLGARALYVLRDLLLVRGIDALLGHIEAEELRAPIVDDLHDLPQAFASNLLRALERKPGGIKSHLRRGTHVIDRDAGSLHDDAFHTGG